MIIIYRFQLFLKTVAVGSSNKTFELVADQLSILMSCQQQSETSNSVGVITSVVADSRAIHTDITYTHKQKAAFIGSEISSLQGLITVDTFSTIPEYFCNTITGIITVNNINYVESLTESYGIETTPSPYDSFPAANEEEMLALTIKLGDRCYRKDLSVSYINISGMNESLDDWDIFGSGGDGSGVSETVVQAMITSAVQPSNTHRTIIVGNPHQVTKADVGLGNVPNVDFTDEVAANTAKTGITPEQANAIVANTAKVGITPEQTNAILLANDHRVITAGNPHQVTKADVGLGNVPNVDFTDDITHLLSLNQIGSGLTQEQLTIIDNSSTHIATVTGNPHQVTKADVGLSNVPNVDFSSTINLNTTARHTHNNKSILDLVDAAFTIDHANAISANTLKVGITPAQANAIVANTAKVGITPAQANAIVANTAKVGITPEQSATITLVDAHITTVSGNPHQVTKAEVGLGLVPNHDFTAEVNANTAKVGITPEQANAIVLNTAKVGVTIQQADAIVVNTAHSDTKSGNPHQVTKADVGFGNVTNVDFTNITNLSDIHRKLVVGNPHNVTKAEVGLGNVPDIDFTDNITNIETHVTTIAGNPHNVTKAEVGLGNVPNVDCTNASNITTGILPTSVLTPLAITDVYPVANEAEMLSLIVQKGDIAVRTDLNKSYINRTDTNTTMTDWQELMTPTDTILSVNGQVGTVVLTTAHIAEGSNLYYTEARVSANPNVSANTVNRHNHTNKSILDATTASFTTEQASDIIVNNDKIGITLAQIDSINNAETHRAIIAGNPHQVTKADVGLGNVPNHDFTAEVNANTAKVGITPEQAESILNNSAHSVIIAGNPHHVTKTDVGLSNVPNINFTIDVNNNTTHRSTISGNPHQVTKAEVGLSLVPNHDFTIQADNADAHIATVTGNPHQVTKADVGLGLVPNHDFTDEVNANTAKVGITPEQAADIILANDHCIISSGNPHQVTKAEVGLSNVPNIDCTNASNITTGILPTSVLPPLAIMDIYPVASEIEQLALTVQKGDIAVRTDIGRSFINKLGLNVAMMDWQELMTPTDTILSVNGQVGTVVLTTSHVDEGSNLYYTEARVIANADVALNTANRHNHVNKLILDNTTASFTTSKDLTVSNSEIHRTTVTGNPHHVTKAEVGLGLVPNRDFTDDIITTNAHIAIVTGNPHQVTKAEVGLGNVPNVDFTDEIAANTAKVGITPEQAAAIVTNTTKVGITPIQINIINQANNHISTTSGNPHQVTKAEVGLGNVPNYDFTTEMQTNNAKVGISPQQAFDIITANTHIATVAGNPHHVTKTDIGLSNVPNTDFSNSVANADAHIATITGNPHNVTKAEVGLGNVPNVDCTNASNITTGTLPTSVLPPLAIMDIYPVATEAEMLALIVQKGDLAIRTDIGRSYVNKTNVNTAMTDWQELMTPTDTILTVNGQVGTVVLTTSHIAEGSNLYYTDARVSANSAVALNTANRHNHVNKLILDNTTASFTTELVTTIATNTAKVGITPTQASAIVDNTAHRNILTGNPHHVTKADIGLNNVPNTDFTSAVTNSVNHIATVTGNPHQVTKAEVGLGNVPNTNFTTDIAASNAHIAIVTGNPHRVTKTDVGLSNVPNVDFTNEIAANTSARHTHSNKAALDLVVGENTGDQEDIIGNAGTATKLASPVLINNIPFDGSDDITIPTGDVTLTGIQTLTNKTLESVTLNKGITEQGYTMPDNIIRANNGSILTKALSANTIFTDALLNGQSITLTITNGASYTVTWPTIVWVSSIGNVAPLMHPNNVFVIWKNGSVLYGTVVGYF